VDSIHFKIGDIVRNINVLEHNPEDAELTLDEIQSLMLSLRKYVTGMRPLLRNLVFVTRSGLCFLFVLYGLHMGVLNRILTTIPVIGVTSILIFTIFQVSRVKILFRSLHTSLTSKYARLFLKNRDNHIHCRLRMSLALKELGNEDIDGHFVIGLAGGNGPALTPNEVFHQVVGTTVNSMMVMNFLHSK
jgi:hypothetical protein